MKRTWPIVIFVLALLGLRVSTAAAAAPPPAAPPPGLDSTVALTLKTFHVPGMGVAIVKDGRVVLAKGYGVKKLSEPAPVTANTLFGIGSLTKAFTTAALATLVDSARISWDDRAADRLPGFRMFDPYVSGEMTVRDLLCHRSGMGLGEGDLLLWPATTLTRAEIIRRLRYMKPASSFRSRYAYDNLLYIAAGEIIPAVTGRSWDEYVAEKILTPAGMVATRVSNRVRAPGEDWAWPHGEVDGTLRTLDYEIIDNCAPAGGICSSASDMARWMLVQLGQGRLPEGPGRLYSGRQAREMWSPHTLVPPADQPGPLGALAPRFNTYALGWGVRDYRGRRVVGHSGAVAGFYSRVLLSPEDSLGVVVLTNAQDVGAFEAVAYTGLDHYMGAAPATDWIAAFKASEDRGRREADSTMKAAAAARPPGSKPSLPLPKYAGTYRDAWYGTVSIRMEGGGAVMRLENSPSAVGDLQHWQQDTFKVHWRDRTIEDAFATFALKPGGAIDHLTMQAVSPLADFSFDYQDLYLVPDATAKEAP